MSAGNRAKGAIVATSSPLGEEAIGKVALHLAEGLARRGLLMRLLYMNGRPLAQSAGMSTRIAAFKIPLLGRFRQGREFLQSRQDRHYQSQAARTVETCGPGLFYGWVLQSHQPLETCRRLGLRSVLECGFIHPVTFKEILTEEFKRYNLPLPWHISDSRVRDSLLELGMADDIVAPSPLVKESFTARGFAPEKFIVMPPGVDCELYRPAGDPGRKKPWALYVGRLELAKGVHHLIAAWSKVKVPGKKLVLVGNMQPCLRTWLDRHGEMPDGSIEFAGVRMELRPYFESAAITVLPSLADGFGMSVMEGMAAGLPAVVTGNCGVRMAVKPGINGWIVLPGQTDRLAETLETALSGPERLAEMGRQARATALEYSWEKFENKAGALLKIEQ